jgi:hypothetical protein
MVRQLLAASPSLLTVTDNAGYTPLHEAALKGRKDIGKELLLTRRKSKGASLSDYVNIKSTVTGDTALHDAVENGHISVVKMLLEGGADVAIVNKGGLKAVDVCGEEDEEMRRVLGVAVEKPVAAKRRPGRPRKPVAEGSSGSAAGSSKSDPDHQSQQSQPLLLVNLDSSPNSLWHFLSCQLEDRSPSLADAAIPYGRPLSPHDRQRLLSNSTISALPSLTRSLLDPARAIHLVDKEAVYRAARHANGRLKVLNDATIQYVDVGKQVAAGEEAGSLPVKMMIKKQWCKQ